MTTFDFVVIGGGILGLSTARRLCQSFPKARILLLEKERGPAEHQTGRNSGVIHSGIYYKPGSYKAKLAKAGALSMVAFCAEHGIPYEVCGKVIVATTENEVPRLDALYERGLQNEVPVEKISPERVAEIEPHVKCVAGVLVKSTGITSYMGVCRKLQELFEERSGEIRFGEEVRSISERGDVRVIKTDKGVYEAKFIINCAGLFSDRITAMAGSDPGARIVPFRGEYFELVPERRYLVKTLIYPVPNPDFPFLGVHFTKMIDGSVHAGPNAVLALKREGYLKTDINLRDLGETLAFGGFWKLIGKHAGEGMKELYRSMFKSAFVKSLQALIPEVRPEDLVVCKAGVRAQALRNDGKLVDDFLFIKGRGALHVCNAPSPAATASLEIAKSIVEQIA